MKRPPEDQTPSNDEPDQPAIPKAFDIFAGIASEPLAAGSELPLVQKPIPKAQVATSTSVTEPESQAWKFVLIALITLLAGILIGVALN